MTRIGAMIGAALLAVIALPAAAAAQSWEPLRPAFGNGVATCNGRSRDGDTFCFGLRCRAGDKAPEWFTHQVGGDSVTGDDVRVNLVVDGRSHSTLIMKQGPTPQGEWSFSSPYDPVRDRAILAQLKGGSGLYVLVGGATGAHLSLRGSSQAIDRVLARCQPAAAASPVAVRPDAAALTLTPGQLPPPVRAEIGQIAAMCGSAFQSRDRSEKALLAEDIDGDGTYDFLLDHARFCPSAILTMCGASHCPLTLFVSDRGAWRRFDFILQGYGEFSPRGFLLSCSTDGRKAGVFMEQGKLTRRNCP